MNEYTNEKNVEATLRLLDQSVATLIEEAADESLRRLFACECARLALSRSGSTDARSVCAVEVSQRFATNAASMAELDTAREAAAATAQIADTKALQLLNGSDPNGSDQNNDGTIAFDCARAAMSACFCALGSARMAAVLAAYEAQAVSRVGDEVVRTARRFLKK